MGVPGILLSIQVQDNHDNKELSDPEYNHIALRNPACHGRPVQTLNYKDTYPSSLKGILTF